MATTIDVRVDAPAGRSPLLRWLGRRAAAAVGVLGALSILVFAATNAIPGDLVQRLYGSQIPPGAREALAEQLALDRPLVERYFDWLGRILTGDLGQSLNSGVPIGELVWPALVNSLILGGIAATVIVPLAFVLGIVAALRPGGGLDRAVSGFTVFGLAVPEFVVAALLIWLLAVVVPAFPAVSSAGVDAPLGEYLQSLVLPVLALIPITTAYMIKAMRASMRRTLAEDFVQLAPLKGLGRRRILWRHAAPVATIPMVAVFALNVGYLVGGIVVVEVIFAYPGIGKLLLDAIRSQDLPIVQVSALLLGTIYIVLNFVSDTIVALLDPRIARQVVR
jgi:peptide/nickel transport system permease protein